MMRETSADHPPVVRNPFSALVDAVEETGREFRRYRAGTGRERFPEKASPSAIPTIAEPSGVTAWRDPCRPVVLGRVVAP